MNNTSLIDTIIIGQGLAGSLLGWQLLSAGQKIIIIDNNDNTSSSRVAAGIINPVTGKRLVKTAKVDMFLPEAISLYKSLGETFNTKFYHPRQMRRIFQSQAEQSLWEKRRLDPEYKSYLGKQYAPNDLGPYRDPLGSFGQQKTGYLDIPSLLTTLATYFSDKQAYRQENIEYGDIRIVDGIVQLHGLRARRLIFCEGHQAINNPWFSNLPFMPVKGEILTLKTEANLPAHIINRGKWLLPLDNGLFKFGATFEWDNLKIKPSPAAKEELLTQCKKIFQPGISYKVVKHAVGIRPSSKDRTPFIGMHRSDKQLGILNGFGAKGSLTIPHYSKLMTDYLLGRGIIPPYADVNRY